MCTIPYNSLAKVFEEELIHPVTSGPVRFHPAIRNGTGRCSKSSSFDFSWLEPALELDTSKGSLADLLPTLADFEYIGRLGDGAFAKVYCVRHIASKQYVAIKVADGSDDQARQQLEVEKQILFRYGCTNPYMIKAYCTFHHGVRCDPSKTIVRQICLFFLDASVSHHGIGSRRRSPSQDSNDTNERR